MYYSVLHPVRNSTPWQDANAMSTFISCVYVESATQVTSACLPDATGTNQRSMLPMELKIKNIFKKIVRHFVVNLVTTFLSCVYIESTIKQIASSYLPVRTSAQRSLIRFFCSKKLNSKKENYKKFRFFVIIILLKFCYLCKLYR